jgi:5-(carboxyamino)imidazole ribonucleotide mutase
MPGGVPIASVGIGGARNAGFFAAAILASSDPAVASRLEAFRDEQAKNVALADERVKAKLSKS